MNNIPENDYGVDLINNPIPLEKTKELFKSIQEKIRDEVFKDVEYWMCERFENVKDEMFRDICNYLNGISKNKDFDEMLNKYEGNKYLKEFYTKIFENNKDTILSFISFDFILDKMRIMFKLFDYNSFTYDTINNFFYKNNRHGYTEQIKKEIIVGFANYLTSQNSNFLSNLLKCQYTKEIEILEKRKKDIQNTINELESKMRELNQDLEDCK